MMPENLPSVGVTRLIGIAVDIALVGLVCVYLFLWHGMGAWSMGLGMFIGMPLLLIAILLYVVAVARDMKRRGAL
ncbi:MAG: hypothetical protein ACERKU_04180 [Nitrospirota bacterium]|jgi:hypothetical protein